MHARARVYTENPCSQRHDAHTVPVERIYEEWKGMKKRYAEPNDAEIYGQQEWAAPRGRLRQMPEESPMF